MKPLTFFRCSLLAPLLLPVASYVVLGITSGVAFLLVMSLAVGGPPYLLVAGFLWVRLGTLRKASEYVHLAFLAPVLFMPFQLVAWLLWSLADPLIGGTSSNLRATLLSIGLYALLFGYAYVLLISLLFVLLRRLGLVVDAKSTRRTEGITNAA
jgi:hypothetical protein